MIRIDFSPWIAPIGRVHTPESPNALGLALGKTCLAVWGQELCRSVVPYGCSVFDLRNIVIWFGSLGMFLGNSGGTPSSIYICSSVPQTHARQRWGA